MAGCEGAASLSAGLAQKKKNRRVFGHIFFFLLRPSLTTYATRKKITEGFVSLDRIDRVVDFAPTLHKQSHHAKVWFTMIFL